MEMERRVRRGDRENRERGRNNRSTGDKPSRDQQKKERKQEAEKTNDEKHTGNGRRKRCEQTTHNGMKINKGEAHKIINEPGRSMWLLLIQVLLRRAQDDTTGV